MAEWYRITGESEEKLLTCYRTIRNSGFKATLMQHKGEMYAFIPQAHLGMLDSLSQKYGCNYQKTEFKLKGVDNTVGIINVDGSTVPLATNKTIFTKPPAIQQYTCADCKKVFTTLAGLSAHSQSHKIRECPICHRQLPGNTYGMHYKACLKKSDILSNKVPDIVKPVVPIQVPKERFGDKLAALVLEIEDINKNALTVFQRSDSLLALLRTTEQHINKADEDIAKFKSNMERIDRLDKLVKEFGVGGW